VASSVSPIEIYETVNVRRVQSTSHAVHITCSPHHVSVPWRCSCIDAHSVCYKLSIRFLLPLIIKIYRLLNLAAVKHKHYIAYLGQECHNSKFGIFELLVWKETFADVLLTGIVS